MHIDKTSISLLLSLFIASCLQNVEADILNNQTNATYYKTDCFERGINIICFKKFLQPAVETLNDTSSSNFLSALWRKINSEADTTANSRHKRQASGVPIRREVRAAPYENNFLRYALAVRRLKYHYGVRSDLNTYDIIASIHTGSNSEHDGPGFLSWHRIYLLLFEAALQAVFGQGVTAPYWDSSLDFAMGNRQSKTIIFSNKYFGTPVIDTITGGFFANLPGRTITRAINGRGGLISKNAIAAVLSRTSHSQIVNQDQVRYCWECYHDIVHRWVGGIMETGISAAFDPIFWCHHSFVDKIWELFRQRLRNAPADYPLGYENHGPNNQMNFSNYRYRPNPPITNQEGFSNRYARLREYDPAPSCQNQCSNSPDLFCDPTRDICVSREAVTSVAQDATADDIASGWSDITTTVMALRKVQQEVLKDIPPGTPLNLFRIRQVDPQTRPLSAFDV
ncbi:tyrosinase [Mytilus galloprovincialis]|uniref:Tyrosinase n=1 Tax=Mytilus galloprovincialis TaxID=29158 RepID=A0A8B6G5P8_MYTGA|nr:tyrosinase [Mytilus galloprovincialis]